MTTAATLIDDALQFLNVSSHLMPADPAQQSRAFTVLKRLFDILPSRSIYLEMKRPLTTSIDLQEPGYATELLVPILGYYLLPYFNEELTPTRMELYKDAVRNLQRKTRRPIRTKPPSTLPRGGGNSDYYSHYYIGDNQYQYTLYDERKEGEIKIYTADFNSEASRRNTTVSTVGWSNIGAENATISGEALSANVATATLSFPICGYVVVKARATFASGEIYDAIFKIHVIDPESTYRDPDNG